MSGTLAFVRGYVAFERVVARGRDHWSGSRAASNDLPAGEAAEPVAVVDDDVTSSGWSLGDTLADLRDLWSQLTFFVFDPASWG